MNYFPFHIGDYAVHTRHLSLMEDLAYRRLLDLYYTHDGVIPVETQSVSRLLGMREQAAEVDAVLSEFFYRNDAGNWAHLRCDEEISRAKAAAERARVNGKGGGRPVGSKTKKAKNQAETQSVATKNPAASKSKAPNTQDQDQEPKGKEKGAVALTVEALSEDGLTVQTATEFLGLRRAKGAKLTARAWQGIKAEAGKAGWSVEQAVCKSLARGWTGFEASWVRPEANGSKQAALESRNAAVIREFLQEQEQ